MQQAHLVAWQTHAPWPKRSQIEQDLRLSRGVAAIFTDEVLRNHLAMRGGTVLHKAHLAPAARYSEDIDLVLTKAMDTDTLEKHLRRVLTPILGEPAPSIFLDAWLALRNAKNSSKILSIKFKFVPIGLKRNETIKVDVNLNEHAALYPLVNVNFQSLDEEGELVTAQAISYDINEMLGTKTRALMQRQQGRDLFDLWFAWSQSQAGATPYAVNGKRAMEAFEWYLGNEGTTMGRAEAAQLLDQRVRNAPFRQDMDTLLRPDLPKFDVDAAASTVRREFLDYLVAP
ncbi:MAG: nucleotidyl transferase AbiEii/AbiGii toxin family protein [Burkholderiales bacterium]|jgi:predicted nucleotidyltransferase component of viral defense system